MKKIFNFIILLLFSSCDYFQLLSNREWMEKSGNDKVTVYIAGEYTNGNTYACYWKDGNLITLPGNTDSQAREIFIYNKDVYIVGYINDTIDRHACYWKNEELYILQDYDLGISMARSICVLEDTVYISGVYKGDQQACYWEDGELKDLEKADLSSSSCYSILAIENEFGEKTIYVSGVYNDTILKPCYWKDGSFKALPLAIASANSFVFSIFFNNANLYMSGYDSSIACYWINGNQYFPEDPGESIPSIKIYNGDIFLGGHTTTNACYWKNGKRIDLGAYRAESISIFDEDIYLAGYSSTPKAYYWKNGVMYSLDDGGAASSSAWSIEVIRKK